MTKEELLKFYETKISIALVYKEVPRRKRWIHNIMIAGVIVLISWPAMELAVSLDEPLDDLTKKMIWLAVLMAAFFTLIFLLFRMYYRNVAKAVKKSEKFSRFYVDESTIDYAAHGKWQQYKTVVKLDKEGYKTKADLSELYNQLGEWMKRERFSLVMYATLFAAIGVPVWSAYLSALFSIKLSFEVKTAIFVAFIIASLVLCAGIKEGSDLYYTVLTKYNRISDVRDVLGNALLRYNIILEEIQAKKIRRKKKKRIDS